MNVLPLVLYELRVAVRRPMAYRTRLLAGGAAMAVCCWGLLIWTGWKSATALGHSLLEVLGWGGFLGSLLAGLFLTSDCISQERRAGTLELLFLTDLRSYDVALGKLAAKGIAPLYCLVGTFPSLAVCLIIGGVTAGEVARLALVLINTLFFSLSLTILTSTFCRRQRAAQASALFALLLTVAAVPLFAGTLSSPAGRSLSLLLSPAGSYLLAFDTGYRGAGAWFWASLLATHLVAWVALGLAGRLLPRVLSAESMVFVRRAVRRSNGWQTGGAARRQQRRRELLSRNPIAWLATRDDLRQRCIWSLPALALWMGLDWNSAPLARSPVYPGLVGLALIHALFKLWVAADTSLALASDRLNGTLELLLSTPLQPAQIARGMLSAFRRRFLGPLVVLLLLDAALAAKFLSANDRRGAFIAGAGAAMLLVDAYSLCWVGLWRGLVARDPARAILATIWRILLVPWLLFAAGVTLFQQSTAAEFVGLWLFVGVVNDAVFVVNAKDFFLRHFRLMALRPFGAKPPRVESRWSPMNWEAEPDGQANS